MDSNQYVGGVQVGGRGSWGAKGRFYHSLKQKSSHYVFTEAHKQPQVTCQAETVVSNSWTPSVALIYHPVALYTP